MRCSPMVGLRSFGLQIATADCNSHTEVSRSSLTYCTHSSTRSFTRLYMQKQCVDRVCFSISVWQRALVSICCYAHHCNNTFRKWVMHSEVPSVPCMVCSLDRRMSLPTYAVCMQTYNDGETKRTPDGVLLEIAAVSAEGYISVCLISRGTKGCVQRHVQTACASLETKFLCKTFPVHSSDMHAARHGVDAGVEFHANGFGQRAASITLMLPHVHRLCC